MDDISPSDGGNSAHGLGVPAGHISVSSPQQGLALADGLVSGLVKSELEGPFMFRSYMAFRALMMTGLHSSLSFT